MDTMVSGRAGMSEAEWQARCDLAALYRITELFGWTDTIDTHMSVRIPGEPDCFLINNYGELFNETTASSLVKLGIDGKVYSTDGRFNAAGFTIHSGVYKARPDANCVMHTHTRAGTGVSVLKKGLRPISQDVLAVWDDLVYHEYGMPTSDEECEALGVTCQGGNSVVLRNHGLLTVGEFDPGRAAPHVHAGACLRGRGHRSRHERGAGADRAGRHPPIRRARPPDARASRIRYDLLEGSPSPDRGQGHRLAAIAPRETHPVGLRKPERIRHFWTASRRRLSIASGGRDGRSTGEIKHLPSS